MREKEERKAYTQYIQSISDLFLDVLQLLSVVMLLLQPLRYRPKAILENILFLVMYKIKKERPSTHTVLAFTESTLHHLLQDCKFTQVIKLNLQFEKDTWDFSQHHLRGLKTHLPSLQHHVRFSSLVNARSKVSFSAELKVHFRNNSFLSRTTFQT